jgi:hypothetical protein
VLRSLLVEHLLLGIQVLLQLLYVILSWLFIDFLVIRMSRSKVSLQVVFFVDGYGFVAQETYRQTFIQNKIIILRPVVLKSMILCIYFFFYITPDIVPNL